MQPLQPGMVSFKLRESASYLSLACRFTLEL